MNVHSRNIGVQSCDKYYRRLFQNTQSLYFTRNYIIVTKLGITSMGSGQYTGHDE